MFLYSRLSVSPSFRPSVCCLPVSRYVCIYVRTYVRTYVGVCVCVLKTIVLLQVDIGSDAFNSFMASLCPNEEFCWLGNSQYQFGKLIAENTLLNNLEPVITTITAVTITTTLQ